MCYLSTQAVGMQYGQDRSAWMAARPTDGGENPVSWHEWVANKPASPQIGRANQAARAAGESTIGSSYGGGSALVRNGVKAPFGDQPAGIGASFNGGMTRTRVPGTATGGPNAGASASPGRGISGTGTRAAGGRAR